MYETLYHRTVRDLHEATVVARFAWKRYGAEGAMPQFRVGREARTKRGSWKVETGVASGVVGLRTREVITLNGPSGLNYETILHELAHALHWRECERSYRTMKAQGAHGQRFQQILARLRSQATVVEAA